MRKAVLGFAAFAAALAVPAVGRAATIHFDEFGNVGTTGPAITNQYAGLGVTFSSTPGNNNHVTTQPSYNSTPPNFICTAAVQGSIDCSNETILDFASGVSGLTFDALGINDRGIVAKVDVFQNFAFSFTFDVVGSAEQLNPLLIDFSAFQNITRIRIHSITDGGGIGWDTFSFDEQVVPEPASLLLIGTGLAGFVARRRRR